MLGKTFEGRDLTIIPLFHYSTIPSMEKMTSVASSAAGER
jgi:hypothetical protein